MLTSEKKKGPFTLQTVYFCEDPAAYKSKTDVCFFAGVAQQGRYSIPHTTLLIDLTQSPEALLAGMCGNYRNEINRMLKGKVPLECREISGGAAELDELMAFQAQFAEKKGLRQANRAHVEAFLGAGQGILLRSANTSTGTVYNYSMWIHDGRQALHYLLATNYRTIPIEEKKAASIAAKYSNYKAMLLLKERGVQTMDLGGVSYGRHSDGRDGIDQFKTRFGGTLCHQYITVAGQSLPGRLLAQLYYYKNRGI